MVKRGRLLLVVVLLVFLVSCNKPLAGKAVDVAEVSLVHFWNFDDGTEDGIIKDMEGTNDLIIQRGSDGVGGTLTTGVLGKGIQLDGVDDYLTVSTPELITGSWTACSWVNLEENDVGKMAPFLDNSESSSAAGQYSLRFSAYGSKKIQITAYTLKDYSFDYELPIQVWKHVCFVSDGLKNKLFVDGQFIGEVSYDLGKEVNLPLKNVGRTFVTSPSGTFTIGSLDEIKIYNVALPVQEVLKIYQAGLPSEPLNYLSRWNFNGDVRDETGRNNGALVGTSSPQYVDIRTGAVDASNVGKALHLVGEYGNYVNISVPVPGTSPVEYQIPDSLKLPEFTFSAWVKP
ncbi:LamG domain-containing protein, partial [Candidatus Woesearchaeota archaeon]|nr:LamG domain-containing protein [Candidatus Woesearchaeota archaeon]